MQHILVKSVFLVALIAGYSWLSGHLELRSRPQEVATSLRQLDGDFSVKQELMESHARRNQLHMAGWIGIGVIAMTFFSTEISKLIRFAEGSAISAEALAPAPAASS